MLGRGQALADQPYYAYTGPLTAGPSDLQNQAFQGIAGLTIPTDEMGAFNPASFTDEGVAARYMNPFLEQALTPQLDEARRQAEISRVNNAARLTKAGAYGGSRQAVSEAELTRAMLANMANITGQGYATAYDRAANQFNTEEALRKAAQEGNRTYGLGALQGQAELGNLQRAIEQEGITADRMQFEEERDFPYKQVQYMQSLLQGLPIAAQSYSYSQPSTISNILGGAGGISSILSDIFLGGNTDSAGGTQPANT
jgi:hypothetical protein